MSFSPDEETNKYVVGVSKCCPRPFMEVQEDEVCNGLCSAKNRMCSPSGEPVTMCAMAYSGRTERKCVVTPVALKFLPMECAWCAMRR